MFHLTIAVDLIMSTHAYPPDAPRNRYSGQGSRERLFIHMRMQEHSRRQDLAIGPENLPPVRVMVPPGIVMANSHRKRVRPVIGPRHFNG